MMIDPILLQLRQLKLSGMAQALQTQSEHPGTYEELSFVERVNLLVESEKLDRDNRKQQRLIRAAKFRLSANAKEIDYQQPRGLQQSQIAGLLQCDWLAKEQNLLITGPCGSGKTYIGCALGHMACFKGFSVRYYRISRLMLELTQAKADGSYSKQLKALAKVDLLILDDWGLEPLSAAHRNDLMEIMDDRHGRSSVSIISQLPTEKWYEMIGDNTLADAILDRVMHNSHRIKLRGESMRKILNTLTHDEQLG